VVRGQQKEKHATPFRELDQPMRAPDDGRDDCRI
jgi:hypothetical protein